MKRVVRVVDDRGFDSKDPRIEEDTSGNDRNKVHPILSTTTRVQKYQGHDWFHFILPGSCVFIASPDRNLASTQKKSLFDSYYMLDLNQMNLILHRTSLLMTLFAKDFNKETPRLPQMADIIDIWTYRGVSVTDTYEGGNYTAVTDGWGTRFNGDDRERYINTFLMGDFFVFNYWGNVKADTPLYFVLKKIPINDNTMYVLSDNIVVTATNEVCYDELLPQNPMPKTTRKMVWAFVPCYPGMATIDNPKGRLHPQPLLSNEELSYYDLDDPIFPAAANYPEEKNGKKKLGYPIFVGWVMLNDAYKPEQGSKVSSVGRDWIRDSPVTQMQTKLQVYNFMLA